MTHCKGIYICFKDLLKANGFRILAMLCLAIAGIGRISGQGRTNTGSIRDTGRVEGILIDERVLLKTDRELYLCGENICFTAFTYENRWMQPVSLSSVLYVELYSQDLSVISKGKFLIKNGKSYGSILIPRTISTDYYYLRAYTRYMQYFGNRQFYLKRLEIVNPFYSYTPDTTGHSEETSPEYQINNSKSDQLPERHFRKASLILETGKKYFGKREEVMLKIHSGNIENKPVKADLSLFVAIFNGNTRDEIPFFEKELKEQELLKRSPGSDLARFSAGPVDPNGKLPLTFIPEMKADLLSGKLLYRDNQPAIGIEVLQSFTGRSANIESFTTGEDGSFVFSAGDDRNAGELILKAVKPERETVIVLDDEFYPDFIPLPRVALQLKKEDIDLIKKEFINIQVADAFTAETAMKPTEVTPYSSAFYGDFYTEYKFSDYAKLPNMKEFIFEIIQGVVSARENKQDVINIIDERTFTRIGPNPLIMIDGVPVSDASVVIGLNPEKVRLVRVVRDKYFLRNQIFDGILDIITYTGDAASITLPEGTFRYNFMRIASDVSVIGYLPVKDTASTIPVYRNMLFFEHHITTDDAGNTEVSFMTPDNSGTYLVQCFGLTPEGVAVEGKAFITVGETPLVPVY